MFVRMTVISYAHFSRVTRWLCRLHVLSLRLAFSFHFVLHTTGHVTDPVAFVTLDGSSFLMLRSGTNIDGSRAGCYMVRFRRYKSKGSVTYPMGERGKRYKSKGVGYIPTYHH